MKSNNIQFLISIAIVTVYVFAFCFAFNSLPYLIAAHAFINFAASSQARFQAEFTNPIANIEPPVLIDEDAEIDALLTENGDIEIVAPAVNDYSVTAADFSHLSYRELQEKVKYHRTVDAPIKLNSKRETLIEYLLTH